MLVVSTHAARASTHDATAARPRAHVAAVMEATLGGTACSIGSVLPVPRVPKVTSVTELLVSPCHGLFMESWPQKVAQRSPTVRTASCPRPVAAVLCSPRSPLLNKEDVAAVRRSLLLPRERTFGPRPEPPDPVEERLVNTDGTTRPGRSSAGVCLRLSEQWHDQRSTFRKRAGRPRNRTAQQWSSGMTKAETKGSKRTLALTPTDHSRRKASSLPRVLGYHTGLTTEHTTRGLEALHHQLDTTPSPSVLRHPTTAPELHVLPGRCVWGPPMDSSRVGPEKTRGVL